MLLKALAGVFEDEGEEKLVSYSQIFNAINQMCR